MIKKLQEGFTLIELIIVTGVIAAMAVTAFVALDPGQRLADGRNSTRWNDVNSLLTAVHSCLADGNTETSCIGTLTDDNVYEVVSNATTGCDDVCTSVTSDTSCADIDTTLAAYLGSLPIDPSGAASGHTEYSISIDSNDIVTITACSAEESQTISVSR